MIPPVFFPLTNPPRYQIIDEQHGELVHLMKKVDQAVADGDQLEVRVSLREFHNALKLHIVTEERVLAQRLEGTPELEGHRKLHTDALAQMCSLVLTMEHGAPFLKIHCIRLTDLFAKHVKDDEKMFSLFLQQEEVPVRAVA